MNCWVDCVPGAVVVVHDCALSERSAQRGWTALQHAAEFGHEKEKVFMLLKDAFQKEKEQVDLQKVTTTMVDRHGRRA